MHPFLIYLLRSIAVSGILYSYYHIVLRNRRMHMFNRFYLLFTVVAGLLLPLVHINWNIAATPQAPGVVHALQIINTDIDEPVQPTLTTTSFNWAGLLLAAYWTISFFILASVAKKIFQLYRLKKHSLTRYEDGVLIVTTTLQQAPFSFLGNLFWNETIDRHSPEGERIMTHELTHIRQHHTIDRLFIEVALAILWLNPLLWLIRKELSLVHEFLADESAIKDNDTGAFAAMLLRAHLGNKYPGIIQPFFYSPVKRRLLMLYKSTTSFSRMRMLAALPLLAATTLLFSFSVKEGTLTKAKVSTAIVIDAGHGGQDAGAVNATGQQEKELNLLISQELIRLAPEYNIKAIPSRERDSYPTLTDRARLAASAHASLFLSVHMNTNTPTEPAHTGYELYVSEKSPYYADSRALAGAIREQLNAEKTVVKQKGLAVLKENTVPGVLVECGTIDNNADVAAVKDPAKREKLCRKILSGIVAYINTTK